MKKFIGTKQIEAEPMTMGEAYEKGFLQAGRVPNEAEKNNPGYHVRYEGGYESWSPAEPFQKAYMPAETFIDRIKIETKELDERYHKLIEFVQSDKFKELTPNMQALIHIQLQTMHDYRYALSMRIVLVEHNKNTKFMSFNFGVALALLKTKHAVRRRDWYGKIFVVENDDNIKDGLKPYMEQMPQPIIDILTSGRGVVDYLKMSIIYESNEGHLIAWTPTISDMLAEDWEIVR